MCDQMPTTHQSGQARRERINQPGLDPDISEHSLDIPYCVVARSFEPGSDGFRDYVVYATTTMSRQVFQCQSRLARVARANERDRAQDSGRRGWQLPFREA